MSTLGATPLDFSQNERKERGELNLGKICTDRMADGVCSGLRKEMALAFAYLAR